MGISSLGIGSGLDLQNIVTALVNADIQPQQTILTKKLNAANSQLSAYGQVKSALSGLQTSLTNLSSMSKIYQMKTSISQSGYFTATASPQAAAGTYQVQVQQLAQKQSLATDYIADTSDLGTGTINISIGSYGNNQTTFTATSTKSIVIGSSNNSITGVRDAINSSNSGVTASIVQDGLGQRLTITSNQTGASNAVQITTTGGSLDALKYDPTDTNTPDGLTQTEAAQDSKVKINGLLLTQNTNQLNNAITGVAINLQQALPGQNLTLTVSNDTDNASSLLSDFVTQYNNTVDKLNSLVKYDASTNKAAPLQGNLQIQNLQMFLTSTITGTVISSNANIQSIGDLGINLDGKGHLQIDQTTLNNALSNNYSEVGSIFAKTGKASDSNIQVTNVPASIKAGQYSVSISEYTAGLSVAGKIGGLTGASNGTQLQGIGSLTGLTINVSGGGLGNRGNITVTDGIGVLAGNLLDSYTKSGGFLDQSIDSVNTQLKSLNKDQTKLTQLQTQLQNNYLRQYSALDTLLGSLQNVSASLSQQLSTLSA